MSYNVAFISLGCAKNQVNCEQMMATCQKAGYTIQAAAGGGRCGGGQHLRFFVLRL